MVAFYLDFIFGAGDEFVLVQIAEKIHRFCLFTRSVFLFVALKVIIAIVFSASGKLRIPKIEFLRISWKQFNAWYAQGLTISIIVRVKAYHPFDHEQSKYLIASTFLW